MSEMSKVCGVLAARTACPDFGGDSKTFMESAANASSTLEGHKIASFIIQGNPWIFYPEENMKVYIYEIVLISHDLTFFVIIMVNLLSGCDMF